MERAGPGGATRTGGRGTARPGVDPGFVSDVFSAFYPLAAASPVLAGLRLEDHGLRWSHAPSVLAHPLTDGTCAVLDRDLDTTAASLDAFAAGDGAAWRRLHELWGSLQPDLLSALFTPFPRSAPPPGWPSGCAPPAGCARHAPSYCRCAGWGRRSSTARAAGCSWPATPSTPTWPPRRPAAEGSAG
ncbi:hypothetical protein GCM10020295_77020 [Streptomyces cinereospinus]